MSLMLKLLATTLLASSTLLATVSDKTVEKFLEKSFKKNPNIKSVKVNIVSKIDLEAVKGWSAFVVNLDARLKKDDRKVSQKMVWFSNGEVITQELVNIKTGESLKDSVSPSFKKEYYKKENLIYGNANAKHKVAIFSDPLCPFCRKFVPEAIKDMKKDPNKFAIYYYHLPLPSRHPAAGELTKAAIAAELKGHKDVVLNLYKVKVGAREKDVEKILAEFNKTMKTNIKPYDLKSPAVIKHYNSDQKIAELLMVQGTPTMFFDGKIDKSKKKYKEAK